MRNNQLYKEARQMFQTGFSLIETCDILTVEFQGEGLPRNEILRTIQSAYRGFERNDNDVIVKGPTYPSRKEIEDVLSCYVNFHEAPDVSWRFMVEAYLLNRGIDVPNYAIPCLVPKQIPELNPRTWAWWPSEWWLNYPICVTLVDHQGIVRNLHARTHKNLTPKTRSAKGFSTSGLVIPGAFAVQWLTGAFSPQQIWVTEGLTDTVKIFPFIHRLYCKGIKAANIGILSGSIQAFDQYPFPNGCEVIVVTDYDDAGEAYYKRIKEKTCRKMVQITRKRIKT